MVSPRVLKRFLLLLLGIPLFGLCVLGVFPAESSGFVPEQPIMPVSALRQGMRGFLLTVLRGTRPVRLPLEIVSVVPQRGSSGHGVMVRLLPSPENVLGVAQGMSGSPVYVNGRLIGALSMGWDFSDHKTAMVTPIEEMLRIFSRPDRPLELQSTRSKKTGTPRALPLSVGGLSVGSLARLENLLGVPVRPAAQGAAGNLSVEQGRFSPGDAIAVLLAWGDVEMVAAGTVTATAKDGRFLAFGHPFLERGAVGFPAARAYVHDTIFSQVFPFKLVSPTAILGTVTQDRAAGLGVRVGYFTPAIAASLRFKDLDSPASQPWAVKNFRVVPDPFLGVRLLEVAYGGLAGDLWGRKGQGTATVTLRVEGRGVERGWARTNLFFSDSDVVSTALKEATALMDAFLLQPFRAIYPIGFRLDFTVTQEPKILMIENVTVSSDARPGETLPVEVVLRPWRSLPVRKSFEVVVPKGASGSCELVVRGGGTSSLPQLAVEGGWKSIDGLERLLTELEAADANNELYIELLCDQTKTEAKKSPRPGDKKNAAELLPEEKEFLSETKARRIQEGTLRISRSEYVVEGLMKRLINLGESGEKSDDDD